MKSTARLVNTSRGPIVDEAALVDTLRKRQIASAAIDVFSIEPLPPDHPFRQLENGIAIPHIGYVSRDLYGVFYQGTAANITKWLQGKTNLSRRIQTILDGSNDRGPSYPT